ncbi:hypothetical protein VPH35_037248 [Triticum aestivum]
MKPAWPCEEIRQRYHGSKIPSAFHPHSTRPRQAETTTAGRLLHRRREKLPPRSSSSEDPPGSRVPGATPLEAPFASPSAAGLRVPERPLDGGLASETPRAKRR